MAKRINRLNYIIDTLKIDPTHNTMILNADPFKDYNIFPNVTCTQWFYPTCQQLQKRGYHVVQEIPPHAQIAVVEITRSKKQTRALIAQAYSALPINGILIINGDKNDGIESHYQAIRKQKNIATIISKNHGKVFYITKTDTCEDPFNWLPKTNYDLNADGFFTCAGIFSEAHLDAGTVLLLENIPEIITGKCADYGAGWGAIATHILANNPKIDHFDIIEADWNALTCAKENIKDKRAEFIWGDISTYSNQLYDMIFMNPPFHKGRKSEPDIGIEFIKNAASHLKPSGQLYLVANRQLAYENTLNQLFQTWRFLTTTPLFKTIVATKPKKHIKHKLNH